MEVSKADGRERCKGIVHAGDRPVKHAIGFSEISVDEVVIFINYDLFEVANYIPKQSKKIACSQNCDYQLYDPEWVDDRNLVIDASVIFEVVVGFNYLLFTNIVDFL